MVGLHQHRFDRGHRVHEGGQQLRGRLAQHAGPDVAIGDQQVDPVPGPGGQRTQQQGGIHRVVELGLITDPSGRGATGVEHDQHVPVPFRSPGAHHDRGGPGGAPPVDRPDVVAGHVLPQAVELRALPPLQDGGPAVQLAQSGQPAGQVLAGVEGRQGAYGPRRAVLRLPSGHPQRSQGPDDHRTGLTVTPPGRAQGQFQLPPLPGRDRHPLDAIPGAGRRGPRVADRRGQVAAAEIGQHQLGLRLLAQPYRDVAVPPDPHLGRGGAQRDVGDDHRDQDRGGDQHRPPGAGHGHGDHRHRGQRRRPARSESPPSPPPKTADRLPNSDGKTCSLSAVFGKVSHQRGTGTVARMDSITESVVTPSSSASGRRLTRCRRVGKASAFTSSGET